MPTVALRNYNSGIIKNIIKARLLHYLIHCFFLEMFIISFLFKSLASSVYISIAQMNSPIDSDDRTDKVWYISSAMNIHAYSLK